MLWLMISPVPGSDAGSSSRRHSGTICPAKAEHALDDRVADRDTDSALGWPYCVYGKVAAHVGSAAVVLAGS